MKLIDRDVLLSYKFKNPISYQAFANLVKRIDTIDLVQCSECVHLRRNPHDRPYCSLVDRTTRDECFCYWGERREE